MHEVITANQMKSHVIQICEPFAQFLDADQDEYQFTISLLDVVRFAGHACPAMAGAFFIAQRAVNELFPNTKTCIRGRVAIDLPAPASQGATGPIANVFSMIFGSWSESGFGGLQGKFVRRGLLRFNVPELPPGQFRFTERESGAIVDIGYNPSLVPPPQNAEELSFQKMWRLKITEIAKNPDKYITASKGHSSI